MATGIYKVSERWFQPWKNGGGETAEIVVSPAGADLDTFDWRISTARVARSGPFSVFPGVDRVLAVLEGGAMRLEIGDETHWVDRNSLPLTFSGAEPCMAHLESGPLLDLNVMCAGHSKLTWREFVWTPKTWSQKDRTMSSPCCSGTEPGCPAWTSWTFAPHRAPRSWPCAGQQLI